MSEPQPRVIKQRLHAVRVTTNREAWFIAIESTEHSAIDERSSMHSRGRDCRAEPLLRAGVQGTEAYIPARARARSRPSWAAKLVSITHMHHNLWLVERAYNYEWVDKYLLAWLWRNILRVMNPSGIAWMIFVLWMGN